MPDTFLLAIWPRFVQLGHFWFLMMTRGSLADCVNLASDRKGFEHMTARSKDGGVGPPFPIFSEIFLKISAKRLDKINQWFYNKSK